MRDYGMVSPQFWIGQTGKALRGNMPAQLVAMYLMTSPHANMIGAYYCPIDYIAKETGLGLDGATKALQSLSEAQFCSFDEQSEEVFVHRMAAYQIGEQLDAKDNRCKGVARELEKVASPSVRAGFRAIYAAAFHLPDEAACKAEKASPSKAPPKPETGTEAETEDKSLPASPSPDPKGSRLAKDWVLPEDWRVWAVAERPDLDATTVAYGFRDYWVGVPGAKGRKLDWEATWRNWVRGQRQGKAKAGGDDPYDLRRAA